MKKQKNRMFTTITISFLMIITLICAIACAGTPAQGDDLITHLDDSAVYEGKVCAAYIALWGVYDPVKGTSRDWTVDDIKGGYMSDLILSFAELSDKDHVSLELDEYNEYKDTVKKVHAKYKDLRISLAIGGASEGTNDFATMAKDATLRATFVKNVKSFLKSNTSICGIDIDWEYPRKGDDITNYISLLKELKQMMNDLGAENGITYRLTTALPADRRNLIEKIAEIQKYLDGINLMMYDYHGAWSDSTGHNAPLDETASALQMYLDAGASPEKIIFGVPFYGQRWTGVKNDETHGLGTEVTKNSDGYDYGIEYPKILELMKDSSYTRYWDDDAKAPYLYSSKKKVFVSYNDPESIGYMAEVAKKNKLGGMMTWEYGQDMTFTLLKAMSDGCKY